MNFGSLKVIVVLSFAMIVIIQIAFLFVMIRGTKKKLYLFIMSTENFPVPYFMRK